jgi:predicted lipoprotein
MAGEGAAQANRRSWIALAGLIIAVACLRHAAGGGSDEVAEDEGQVLADFGPSVLEPALQGFALAAADLSAACAGWSEGPPPAEAQEAWRQAAGRWQVVEVLQIGPLSSSLLSPRGEDLRDAIYSWPTVNPCAVDQETFALRFDQPDYAGTALVNVLGLDALEHLLFAPDAGNACPPQVPFNSDGGWDAAGEGEIWSRRAAHAKALADHLAALADTLVERFGPEGEDLSAQLGRAGQGDSSWPDATEALDEVFRAGFYLEKTTKDLKVARPLGLKDCGTETCPEAVEHLPSGFSQEALAANLEGFRAWFTGGEGGFGFEDLLRERGEDALADLVLADLDAAEAAVAALPGPLDLSLEVDPTSVSVLHAALSALGDHLKGDLATSLRLSVPAEAAGDND